MSTDAIKDLERLMEIAHMGTGQSGIVINFLLSVYNGYEFKFALHDFNALDEAILINCIRVLQLRYYSGKEIHKFVEDGDAIFTGWAKRELKLRKVA